MSNAQHTPGPWQVNHHDHFQVCDSDGENRGCSPIARMEGGTKAESLANARLIAAAPELLAALEMVMAKYSKHLDGFAFEQCHAAIAKTKGKS